jgi:TolB protein
MRRIPLRVRALSTLLCILAAPPALAGPPEGSQRGPLVRHTRDGFGKRRPSWSPDGKRLAFARHEPDGEHLWQYVLDVGQAGSAPRRLLADRETPHFDATYSPDGKRLLLVADHFVGTQGNLDIAALNADGTGLKVVASEEGGRVVHQEWPAWSPDGKRFAFSSTHEGNQELYTASADGTDVVRLTRHPGQDAHPCWSPDGKAIAFATDRWGGGLELATVRPDGTGVARLTDSPGLDDYPAYSPDGARLAFVSNRDGQHEVYLSRADGSRPVNLTAHPSRDTFPTWTPDGRGVTFVSDRDRGFDVYTLQVGPVGSEEIHRGGRRGRGEYDGGKKEIGPSSR